jgi:hypothetical protein
MLNDVLPNSIVYELRTDTILSRSQEQNLLNPTSSSMPQSNSCPLRTLLLTLGLLFAWGCSSQEPKTDVSNSPVANKDRPPLKIGLIDAPELERELKVRWQAASDQPIQIENVAAHDIAGRSLFAADVVIFPGNLMGDLIHKGVIGKLPPQAMAKSDSQNSPARWQGIASYGGHVYAQPLGATNLAAIVRRADIQPLVELDGLLTEARGLNASSESQWTKFLNSIEVDRSELSQATNESLDAKLSNLSHREKDWLVERFLWIAATTDARRKGLFDLAKMDARLNQPEFAFAAKVLARLLRSFPETLLDEPPAAWNSVTAPSTDKTSFAIGWPKSQANENTETNSATQERAKVAPLVWNANHGLVASVGKNTRQTSVSCKFLLWLCEPEQREAFRSICPRIELFPTQIDRDMAREDYREFQLANSRDKRKEGMELSLRLANADQYRALLADSLIAAIRSPDQSTELMAQCSQSWNELTTKLGKETQRLSEEQSMGYQK